MSAEDIGKTPPTVAQTPPAGARVRRRWLVSGRRRVGRTTVLLTQLRDGAPRGLLPDGPAVRELEPRTASADRARALHDPGWAH